MTVASSIFPVGHIYDLVVADGGRQRAFVCLVSMLGAFFLIRTSARMTRRFTWWPGGVETDGMHLHHFVWGIFLMMGSGFVGVSLHLQDPGAWIVAVIFGVGAGFTLDEFALWTRMEDVYWSQKGRSSIEAVGIVATVGTLIVIGVRPFDLDRPASAATVSLAIALTIVVSVIAFLKGRMLLGVMGLFILPVGLWGAIRVGHPDSPWARKRYPQDCARLRRARRRFGDPNRLGARLRRRLEDVVGGRPSTGAAPDRSASG